MKAVVLLVDVALAGVVWIGLARWRLRTPYQGGRTGMACFVAAVLLVPVGLIASVGVAFIQLTQCSFENFFADVVDCGPATSPLVAVWLTACTCVLAIGIRSAYTGGRRSR